MTTLYPTVRLDAVGLTSLVVDYTFGVVGQSLDLGDAVTREVVEDAPDADGTIDTTAHTGARNITLVVVLTDDADMWTVMTRLRAFTAAKLRPTLTVQQTPTAPVQRATLRRGQWSDPIGTDPRGNGSSDETQRTVTVQWVAPLGILESDTLHTSVANAGGGTTAGRTYPLTFPRVYPASSPSGQALVTNAGTTDAYPIIRVYGPAGSTTPTDDIVVENRTQGKSIVLSGLQILAGEFVELDTRNKNVFYLGDPTDSRYSKWNTERSQWWSLSPGVNDIRYTPETFSTPSNAAVEYRDAYL